MQNVYTMQFIDVVSSMARLTTQEDTLLAHLSRVLKMFIYIYTHDKIFNIYNMQNVYTMQFIDVVSSMARLTTQEGTLLAHLSRVLKMFLETYGKE